MTVREMLSRLDSHEIAEWIAYEQLDPWGEKRADLRSGIIATTVANSVRSSKDRPAKIEDFLPQFGPKPHQDEKRKQEILSHKIDKMMGAMNAYHNKQ